MQHATELEGIPVIDLEKGAILGTVIGMTLDPETAVIASFVYTAPKGKQVYFVPTVAVQKIGQDVVFLKGDAGQAIDDIANAPGLSLKELQGRRVTTMEGRHLGTLMDIDFSSVTWRMTDFLLAEGKQLTIEADSLKIGDEILVPAGYEGRLQELPKERYGAIGRLVSPERIDDFRSTIARIFRKKGGEAAPEG